MKKILWIVLAIALGVLEIIIFSLTTFALKDLLGELTLYGISYATLLAILFCGIDLIIIAGFGDQPPPICNIWVLLSAWALGIVMDGILITWAFTLPPKDLSLPFSIGYAVMITLMRTVLVVVLLFSGFMMRKPTPKKQIA